MTDGGWEGGLSKGWNIKREGRYSCVVNSIAVLVI